ELTQISPKGTLMAAAFDSVVQVYSLADGKSVQGVSLDATVISMAFAPEDDTLAVTLDDGTIRLIDLATGLESITLRSVQGGGRLIFSVDGCVLVVFAEHQGRGYVRS